MALTLGEAFGAGFGWKHDVSDSCEIIARKRVRGRRSTLCVLEVWTRNFS